MFGQRDQGLHEIFLPRKQSPWAEFLARPAVFLAKKLYNIHQGLIPTTKPPSPITVVCISDTHNHRIDLPDGDILIHAGDLTEGGTLSEIQSTIDWLNMQPHRHKIVIAGNHELVLDSSHSSPHSRNREDVRWGGLIYLQNQSVTLKCAEDRVVTIYGSPNSPRYGNWAFQYPRTFDNWMNQIPVGTDILITHAPPKGHLDLDSAGCEFLMNQLWRLKRKPLLHVFGHVHGGYGVEKASFDRVQRAYDNVIAQGGGFLSLLWMAFLFLISIFAIRLRRDSMWFVNAAIAEGLRNERTRAPISVDI
ncbi:hypothetical protein FQN50_006820 [Emmonsiellopsis sp. PD_5]|nr:hypothetical protein FQN50_006820 [Emmonsiellopsis sp. PD_5]